MKGKILHIQVASTVLHFFALENNRKSHRTPQNCGKKPKPYFNIHQSPLTLSDMIHLPCPLETSHDVKVQRSKLMHKVCFECIDRSDGWNKKGGRWSMWRGHKYMDIRHHGKSFNNLHRKNGCPTKCCYELLVPKELCNSAAVLSTFHFAMSTDPGGQKYWEILCNTDWLFFPVLGKIYSEHSLKSFPVGTLANYVYLFLLFSLLYTPEDLEDHVARGWFN